MRLLFIFTYSLLAMLYATDDETKEGLKRDAPFHTHDSSRVIYKNDGTVNEKDSMPIYGPSTHHHHHYYSSPKKSAEGDDLIVDHTDISSTVSESDTGDNKYPSAMYDSFAYDSEEAKRRRMKDSIRNRKKSEKVYKGPSSEFGTTSTSSGIVISFSIKKAHQASEEEED